MIVVDSNVVAYLYLPGDHTGKAEVLLEQDPDWAVPLLWRSEFRNILAGYMRRKTLTFDQMLRVPSDAVRLTDRHAARSDRPDAPGAVRTPSVNPYTAMPKPEPGSMYLANWCTRIAVAPEAALAI